MSTFNFKNATADYRFLKNKQYPEKAALKLVGDRYRLSTVERNCLLRGVVENRLCEKREIKKAIPDEIKGNNLGIDWYNVLITVESYLKGSLLFLADDGIIRDASRIHGSYRQSRISHRAISIIIATLTVLSPRHVDIFFDSPISHSKKMRDELELLLAGSRRPFSFSLEMAASADYPLKSYSGIVASSDSIIVDSAAHFIDLPALALAKHFSFQAAVLDDLFPDRPGIRPS